MIGFVIPFLVSISLKPEGNKLTLNLLYFTAMITQVFFMSFEFAQLKEQKLAYFKDPWNLLDSGQFASFTCLFVIKMLSQFDSDTFIDILLSAFILF